MPTLDRSNRRGQLLMIGFLSGVVLLLLIFYLVVGRAQPRKSDYLLHESHVGRFSMECSQCHLPQQPDSIVLRRPGHPQCLSCHPHEFQTSPSPPVCQVCHASFPPSGSVDLLPFPQFEKEQAILFRFSHAGHLDKTARLDARTGYRADCTFCHKFQGDGVFASFPGHVECGACHSKAGIRPSLSARSTTIDCQQCHAAREKDNPGFSKGRRLTGAHRVSGVAVDLKFSHLAHLRQNEKQRFACTTCHYGITQSQSLADLSHPEMVDCVACHDGQEELISHFRMADCQACHIDRQTGVLPASHTRSLRPSSHTAGFRRSHQVEASASNSKCFACHTNLSSSDRGEENCAACHQVMRPLSHTPRWSDTIHGKDAALDRQACALCHTADTCSRCHNQLPRSHAPLALFKAGAHAELAMLELRSCFTCHTFENTCAACHVR